MRGLLRRCKLIQHHHCWGFWCVRPPSSCCSLNAALLACLPCCTIFTAIARAGLRFRFINTTCRSLARRGAIGREAFCVTGVRMYVRMHRCEKQIRKQGGAEERLCRGEICKGRRALRGLKGKTEPGGSEEFDLKQGGQKGWSVGIALT